MTRIWSVGRPPFSLAPSLGNVRTARRARTHAGRHACGRRRGIGHTQYLVPPCRSPARPVWPARSPRPGAGWRGTGGRVRRGGAGKARMMMMIIIIMMLMMIMTMMMIMIMMMMMMMMISI